MLFRSKDITIYGEGNQTRSFCYIDDMVEALIRMMNQDKYIGPVNLGNPGEYKIKELAEMIIDLTNSDSRVEYKELPADDPKQRRPDITLAKEILDWAPTIPVKEGLQKTINYFKTRV